ncbi:helix-turn-helix domain-containing protein [Salmonella enterica]|nr:helix-turn-helix domain-containing protein [Salmonella enterica]
MKTKHHSISLFEPNGIECVAVRDPSAKTSTLLQCIEYHANEILEASNSISINNDSEIANHAACIIDLAELCTLLANINISSPKDHYENSGIILSPSSPASTRTVSVKSRFHTPYDSGITIGDRIFDMRNLREMTREKLAESVGVSPNLVAAWEKNSLEPRAKHVIPLANALKCDLMWLLTGNATHQDLPDTGNGEHQYRHASQQAGDVSHEAPQR